MKKGYKHSEKSKRKLSESHKGIRHTKETKKKLSEIGQGRKHTEETKRKISKTKKGKKMSEEFKQKMREKMIRENNRYGFQKGHKVGMTGKKHTEESKRKMSLARKGELRPKGEKSHAWRGGISYEPYSIDWTKTLKRSIRERDNYTCQLCGKPQDDRTHCVHHIDYDKKNCNPDNLSTLCVSCNVKVNYNRKYWLNYFKLLLNK